MTVRRVAVISYHSSPLFEPGSGDAGGMTVYVRQLARALARHGVYTDVFTRASDVADRTTSFVDGVRVIPIEAGPRARVSKEELPAYIDDFVGGVKTFAASQRIRYDVVHSHYWQSGLAGKALGEIWGAPLVHSHHTLGRVKNAALAPGDRPEPAGRLAGEQEVIGGADVLIASTEDEYHQLSCLYRASHDRLKILVPGVDHFLFRPGARRAARDALGLDDGPIVLFVGRIQPLKGIELALRALEQLKHALERPPLLMVVGGASGNGGDREVERLQTLADELGIAEQVRFVGPQPHTLLPTFYQASDVVAVTSYSESFGFAALEAHACGRPVVGTPVGGLSHIVQDGVSGYLIDGRDPSVFAGRLKTLLTDEQLREDFGTRAAMAAIPFTWENAAAELLELYECLVSETFPEVCTC
ncbi:MAG: glycosyltransferase [Actinomycetota bacterium]